MAWSCACMSYRRGRPAPVARSRVVMTPPMDVISNERQCWCLRSRAIAPSERTGRGGGFGGRTIGKSDNNRVGVRNPVLIRSPYLHITAHLLSLINQLAHSIQVNNANYPSHLSHTSFPPSEGAPVFIMAATKQIVLRWGSILSLVVNYWF